MRKKTKVTTIKLTTKNKIYLERLGYLDGRTGGSRKNGLNLNKFINGCITKTCESEKPKNVIGLASSEELREAWIKHNIIIRNKEIERLQSEMVELSKKRPKKEEIDKVMAEFSKNG